MQLQSVPRPVPPPQPPRPASSLLLSQGYGCVPKAVMADRRLACSAKALYAYLCSCAGKCGVAWPSADRICFDLGFGPTVFRAGLKSLVEVGYVSAVRERRANRFTRYVYTLAGSTAGAPQAEAPEKAVPPAENPPMANPSVDTSPVEGPPMANPSVEGPPMANPSVDTSSIAPQTAARAATNNTNVSNTTNEDDEDSSTRARARTRDFVPPGDPPGKERDAVGRWFREAYGRLPNASEASMLVELLGRCSPQAVRSMILASAEHAPAAPAPYVRRMAQRFRSGAVAMGLLAHPLMTLTHEMIERVEDRDRPCG